MPTVISAELNIARELLSAMQTPDYKFTSKIKAAIIKIASISAEKITPELITNNPDLVTLLPELKEGQYANRLYATCTAEALLTINTCDSKQHSKYLEQLICSLKYLYFPERYIKMLRSGIDKYYRKAGPPISNELAREICKQPFEQRSLLILSKSAESDDPEILFATLINKMVIKDRKLSPITGDIALLIVTYSKLIDQLKNLEVSLEAEYNYDYLEYSIILDRAHLIFAQLIKQLKEIQSCCSPTSSLERNARFKILHATLDAISALFYNDSTPNVLETDIELLETELLNLLAVCTWNITPSQNQEYIPQPSFRDFFWCKTNKVYAQQFRYQLCSMARRLLNMGLDDITTEGINLYNRFFYNILKFYSFVFSQDSNNFIKEILNFYNGVRDVCAFIKADDDIHTYEDMRDFFQHLDAFLLKFVDENLASIIKDTHTQKLQKDYIEQLLPLINKINGQNLENLITIIIKLEQQIIKYLSKQQDNNKQLSEWCKIKEQQSAANISHEANLQKIFDTKYRIRQNASNQDSHLLNGRSLYDIRTIEIYYREVIEKARAILHSLQRVQKPIMS